MQTKTLQILDDLRATEEYIHQAITMAEAGRSGIGILHQIIAAKGTLSKVNAKISSRHIEDCTRNVLESKIPEERMATVQRLVEFYGSVLK